MDNDTNDHSVLESETSWLEAQHQHLLETTDWDWSTVPEETLWTRSTI